jgi:hypothetical protein
MSAAPDYRTFSLAIRLESKGIGAGGARSYGPQNDGHEAIPPRRLSWFPQIATVGSASVRADLRSKVPTWQSA